MYKILLFLIPFCRAGFIWPEQLRLSWTEREGEMRVSWATYFDMGTIVRYRPILCDDVTGEWFTAEGESKQWNQATFGKLIQFVHTVVLKGLRPECYYEYQAGSNLFMSSQAVFSGRTPDYSAPFESSPVSFIVFGDLGTGPNGKYTTDLMKAELLTNDFSAVLHIGDMAYNLHEYNGRRGDQFMNMVQPISSFHPYMAIPGNHEHNYNFTHYSARFLMPYNEAAAGTNMFYSFDMGPAHFIMFNTEPLAMTTHRPEEAQTVVNWLKDDIAKANQSRDIRPWIIALSHHPLYCSHDWIQSDGEGSTCIKDHQRMKPYIEDLFYKEGVDLFMQAHIHKYERAAAVYNNQTVSGEYDDQNRHLNPKATVYITTGAAGNRESNTEVSKTPAEWSRFLSKDIGYGKLTVHNRTHVYFEQISAEKNTVIDYVWIEKTRTRNFQQLFLQS